MQGDLSLIRPKAGRPKGAEWSDCAEGRNLAVFRQPQAGGELAYKSPLLRSTIKPPEEFPFFAAYKLRQNHKRNSFRLFPNIHRLPNWYTQYQLFQLHLAISKPPKGQYAHLRIIDRSFIRASSASTIGFTVLDYLRNSHETNL